MNDSQCRKTLTQRVAGACLPRGGADPADAAVLRAVDEIPLTADLGDETWEGLSAAAGEEGAIDLLLIAGWYHAISYAAPALRLTREPGTQRLAG